MVGYRQTIERRGIKNRVDLRNKWFAGEWTANQTDLVIVTPEIGKCIVVDGVYMATNSNAGQVIVKAGNEVFAKLYASVQNRAVIVPIQVIGEEGCSISVTTTTGDSSAFVLVTYRETDIAHP